MSERDEYNNPSPEQELHSPREEYAPAGEEYARPDSGENTMPTRRKRRSRMWLFAAVFMLAAVVGFEEQEAEPVQEVSEPIIVQEPEPAPEMNEPVVPEEPEPEPEPEPVRELTDAEILLAQGTWETGTGLIVHFDAGGGWWQHEDMLGIMSWSEDEDGHVAYSGSASYKEEHETESGPRMESTTTSCSGTVYLDRSQEQYSITMDNPFALSETLYYGSENNIVNGEMTDLYGITAAELIQSSQWELSELEENEERLALAIQDGNPYNRKIVWPSGLTLEGDEAVITFSDIYGGTKDYPSTCKQLSDYEFLVSPILPEVSDYDWAFKYQINTPEGGVYNDDLWGFPDKLTCRVAYCESGMLLIIKNPFASWLYQDDVSIMKPVK